jgi:hypothetical protein
LLTLGGLVGILGLAAVQGAMVAAPRAGALAPLGRFRSPLWAGALPAAIVIGTFGVLALPRMAPALVVIAFVATPLLAALATLGVVRGTRVALAIGAVALAAMVIVGSGWVAQLAHTLLTALGCLAAGAIVVRLVPRPWLPLSMLTMCATDVVLLGLGLGQPAGSLMALAASHVPTPVLDHASIGPISTDYPDLLLAAVLGSALGGAVGQRRAALLVAALVAGYGLLLPLTGTLPATVPIAVAFVLLRWRPCRRRARGITPRRVPEAPAMIAGGCLPASAQEAPA